MQQIASNLIDALRLIMLNNLSDRELKYTIKTIRRMIESVESIKQEEKNV